MNLIFIAPPASGKGTLSDLLATNYNYKHISTGDLLREEIKSQSDLGLLIKEKIDKGELVSDEIITELLTTVLKNLNNQNFILDGYPRNITQADILKNLFQKLNINNYKVIYLDIEKDIAKKRALGRIVCENCGSTYNKYFTNLLPKIENACDKCQSPLISRSDDTEETFNKRFDTYLTQTKPVLDYYQEQEKLVIINANNTVDEAYSSIVNVLGD